MWKMRRLNSFLQSWIRNRAKPCWMPAPLQAARRRTLPHSWAIVDRSTRLIGRLPGWTCCDTIAEGWAFRALCRSSAM